ncbi:MAG: hypothetical protein WCG83_02125 [Candidatus Peregrinibacteria bacterium]
MANPLSSLSPVSRKVLSATVLGVIALVVGVGALSSSRVTFVAYKGIPIPFLQESIRAQGSVSYYSRRSGIDVYEMTFTDAESSGIMQTDRIYLVHVPAGQTVANVSLDRVVISEGNTRDVDYYGYKYEDATASVERAHKDDALFRDRFPGRFFASQKAWAYDDSLSKYAGANNIIFLKTDPHAASPSDSSASVDLEPGSLYVFVVNDAAGARLVIRGSGTCGNEILEPSEDCDNGVHNGELGNSCAANCTTTDIPIPFGSGSLVGSGARLSIVPVRLPPTASAVAGETGITLISFMATATNETIFIGRLQFVDVAGTLDDTQNYQLWYDSNNDGTVDSIVQIVPTVQNNLLTFDTVGNDTTTLASGQSRIYALRADVKDSVQTGLVQLQFNVTDPNYIRANKVIVMDIDEQLTGLATNGVCSAALCQIDANSAPSTLWTLQSIASNPGRVDITSIPTAPVGEDGSIPALSLRVGDVVTFSRIYSGGQGIITSGFQWNWDHAILSCDGFPDFDSPDFRCTATAAGATNMSFTAYMIMADNSDRTIQSNVIGVVVQEPVGSGSNVAIRVQNLPSALSARINQPDITLLRFEAQASDGEDLLLNKLIFEAESGSLLNATDYTVWVDTNNDVDHRVDQVMQSGVSPDSGVVTFNDGVLVKKSESVFIEVHAKVAVSLQTNPHLQLRFATGLPNYVGGIKMNNGTSLDGISTDGVCVSAPCAIAVRTLQSTLWQLANSGNLFITKDPGTAYAPRQILAGMLSEPLLRLTFVADSEPIDITDLVINSSGSDAASVSALELWPVGASQALITSTSCGADDVLTVNPGASDTRTQAFCFSGMRGQLVIHSANPPTLVDVRARINSNLSNGVSKQTIALFIDPTPVSSMGPPRSGSVHAYGVTSSNLKANTVHDGQGRVYIGTSDPLSANQKILSQFNTTVLSKFQTVANGDSEVVIGLHAVDNMSLGSFLFSVMDNPNSSDGGSYSTLSDIVFTIQSKNVDIEASSFTLSDMTSGSANQAPCTSYKDDGVTSMQMASGSYVVACRGLATSVLNTKIPANSSAIFTLLGRVINDNTSSSVGGSSFLTVSLTNFTDASKTFGTTPSSSHIRWIDHHASGVTFDWIENSSSTIVHATTRGDAPTQVWQNCPTGGFCSKRLLSNQCTTVINDPVCPVGKHLVTDASTCGAPNCAGTCSECVADTVASAYPLTITTKTLAATAQAVPNQQGIVLYRFEASSNTGILLTTFQFKTVAGSFDNAVHYGLYRVESNGTSARVLDGIIMSPPGEAVYLKFFGSAQVADRIVDSGSPATYDVRADAVSVFAPSATLQLGFNTSSVNHATGRRLYSDWTLGNDSRIGGKCLFSCQIDEIDVPSTLWSFHTVVPQ